MDGDASRMIAEIKTAIENGILTRDEMERRLEAAIAAEIAKDDSTLNAEMIRVCTSMLWQLRTHGKEPFVDDTQEALVRFKKRVAVREKKTRQRRVVIRVAAATVAIFLMGIGIEAFVNRGWLEGAQSPDEQQYVISGQEIDPGLIGESQADNAGQSQTITTTDLNEAVSVLGYTPPMPTWLPDGWAVENYYANHIGNITSFGIRYQRAPDEDLLRFSITTYSDVESAIYEFEQGKTGIETQCNGWTVYISENTDAPMAVWREDTACYSITGPISKDELLQIIQSIQRSVDS